MAWGQIWPAARRRASALFGRWFQMDFHAPITGAAPFGVVGRNGLPFAGAAGFDALIGNAEIDEGGADRMRAPFGETLIVSVRADGVGVADDVDDEAWMTPQRLRQIADHRFELITHVGAIKGEGDVGGHADD